MVQEKYGVWLAAQEKGWLRRMIRLQPVIHDAEPPPLHQGRYVCVGLSHDALGFGTVLLRASGVLNREPTVGIGDGSTVLGSPAVRVAAVEAAEPVANPPSMWQKILQ